MTNQMDQEVEEARIRLGAEVLVAPGSAAYFEALDALIEAVRRQAWTQFREWATLPPEEAYMDYRSGLSYPTRQSTFNAGWQAHERSVRARSSEEADDYHPKDLDDLFRWLNAPDSEEAGG